MLRMYLCKWSFRIWTQKWTVMRTVVSPPRSTEGSWGLRRPPVELLRLRIPGIRGALIHLWSDSLCVGDRHRMIALDVVFYDLGMHRVITCD